MTEKELVNTMVEVEKWTKRSGLQFLKTFRKKGKNPINVYLLLQSVGNGRWKVNHPSYHYECYNSGYTSIMPEYRLTRNRLFLLDVAKGLRRNKKLWESIVNHEFFCVNTKNKKSNKGYLESELKALLIS
jgi:hypothetical protein